MVVAYCRHLMPCCDVRYRVDIHLFFLFLPSVFFFGFPLVLAFFFRLSFRHVLFFFWSEFLKSAEASDSLGGAKSDQVRPASESSSVWRTDVYRKKNKMLKLPVAVIIAIANKSRGKVVRVHQSAAQPP